MKINYTLEKHHEKSEEGLELFRKMSFENQKYFMNLLRTAHLVENGAEKGTKRKAR